MKGKRSCGDESVRTAILDAAEQILTKDGPASVTSRRVAARAGLKSQLVHYYFQNMDALYIALLRRVEERHFERLVKAKGSSHPVRALSALSTDSEAPRLSAQFLNLAVQRNEMREEIVHSGDRTCSVFVALLTRVLDERGLNDTWPSPTVLAFLMSGAARSLISETVVGMTMGHAEVRTFIEETLQRLEGTAAGGKASDSIAMIKRRRSSVKSSESDRRAVLFFEGGPPRRHTHININEVPHASESV